MRGLLGDPSALGARQQQMGPFPGGISTRSQVGGTFSQAELTCPRK